jgi:cysteine-S-conjugate beta-lyase
MGRQVLGSSVEELRATRTSVKWRTHGPDVLPLWVAEMDTAPCPPVVEAVTAALARGDVGYAWSEPLVEAFVRFASRRWGWEVDAGRVRQLPDVMIGIEEIIHAHVPADRAVVVSPPCYDSFYGFVASTRRRLVEAPLGADHRLDPDRLAAAFADAGAGSAYILCNPQNPTGTVHTSDELATLARIADRAGVLVISDEIHAPLVHPGVTFTPWLTAPGVERGAAIVSGSKAWNLAGLKTALAVAAPGTDLALHEVVTHGAQHLAVIAQTAAYDDGEAWLDQLHVELAQRREMLARRLPGDLPGVIAAPAQATYLAWLDCSALGLEDPHAAFLRAGVATSAGRWYDRAAEAHVRLNLGTSASVLDEALTRMAVAVP